MGSLYKAALKGYKPCYHCPIGSVCDFFRICGFYGGPCSKLLVTGNALGVFPEDTEKSYDFCSFPQPEKPIKYFDLNCAVTAGYASIEGSGDKDDKLISKVCHVNQPSFSNCLLFSSFFSVFYVSDC